ncbi:glycosyltransferase [Corallincola holothuriorum]|uniref:glycosyltransferase n=1 Tax=Corallincola holothuriorum TaxID=2282215 RepID=UPI001314EE83|nr:glycosyltransferase [Corallincola holothuriorum]
MAVSVSVIIPAYNREAYIEETINSVLYQTFQNFELIVVDDGSTDNTRNILESFDDERISILEHPGRANKGQSAAINLGLKHAKGEFIAILDSDDYWLPEKLEIQVAYLQQHNDIGLVYANGTAVDPNRNHLYPIYNEDHRECSDPGRVLKDCYFFVPTNSLVRSEVIRKVGEFDESLRAAQDHDMAIRIAETTKLAYINTPLFAYRRHPESISSTRAHIRWQNGFYILDKAIRRFNYPSNIIRSRKAVLHFRLYQCRKRNGQFLSAIGHLLTAGYLDPARSVRVLCRKELIT